MNTLLRLLVALPAILFVFIGLRWAVDPAGAAELLGMALLDGMGRSSQIGDVGAFFLGGGAMILIALITGRKSWFYAAALMMALVAIFRIVAWLAHDAALAVDSIALEVIVASLLLFASTRLAQDS